MYVPVSHITSSQTWSASIQLHFTGVAKISSGSLISRLFSIEKMRCKSDAFMDCRSLRSSRFLSFSKRSRTGGKLRKSGKISSRGRGCFSPIFLLTPGVLLRSPAFRSLVRSPRRLKKERNRLLRRLCFSKYFLAESTLIRSGFLSVKWFQILFSEAK